MRSEATRKNFQICGKKITSYCSRSNSRVLFGIWDAWSFMFRLEDIFETSAIANLKLSLVNQHILDTYVFPKKKHIIPTPLVTLPETNIFAPIKWMVGSDDPASFWVSAFPSQVLWLLVLGRVFSPTFIWAPSLSPKCCNNCCRIIAFAGLNVLGQRSS